MADPEHLEILKQGVEVWNKWREQSHIETPDLRDVNLIESDLAKVNFIGVDLTNANLNGADLRGANLGDAILKGATLTEAHFGQAELLGVSFIEAELAGAKFVMVELGGADFSRAKLTGSELLFADLGNARLNETDLSQAKIGFVTFNNNDLSTIKGLDTVSHIGPSSIGIDTIYKSGGNIPELFLRGCGVPDEFITYMRSLVSNPIQFYSCFISYSSKNQIFADRLYADLQNKGVRCWLASEDLKIGDKTRIAIDESIRFHDKLLLVLSKHSVASDWVEQEVETALERERKEKRLVLFPIRLDDAVMKIEGGWPALIRHTRNIGDFRKWKQHDSYQNAFDRLLRDLKASE